jgi:hypothetical protein
MSDLRWLETPYEELRSFLRETYPTRVSALTCGKCIHTVPWYDLSYGTTIRLKFLFLILMYSIKIYYVYIYIYKYIYTVYCDEERSF